MYTQCPQCLTYFQVTPEHLRIAQGNVRCGQCRTVFSALGNLTEEPPQVAYEENENDIEEEIFLEEVELEGDEYAAEYPEEFYIVEEEFEEDIEEEFAEFADEDEPPAPAGADLEKTAMFPPPHQPQKGTQKGTHKASSEVAQARALPNSQKLNEAIATIEKLKQSYTNLSIRQLEKRDPPATTRSNPDWFVNDEPVKTPLPQPSPEPVATRVAAKEPPPPPKPAESQSAPAGKTADHYPEDDGVDYEEALNALNDLKILDEDSEPAVADRFIEEIVLQESAEPAPQFHQTLDIDESELADTSAAKRLGVHTAATAKAQTAIANESAKAKSPGRNSKTKPTPAPKPKPRAAPPAKARVKPAPEPAVFKAPQAAAPSTEAVSAPEAPKYLPAIPSQLLEDFHPRAALEAQHQPAGTLWSLGSIVLMMLFLLQTVYFKHNDLARVPQLHTWIENFCGYLACDLSLPSDVRQLELVSQDIRSHPRVKSALLVTTTIINNAGFAQPYPGLQITFSDLNGQRVAMRRFAPNEYLSPTVPQQVGMPPNTPIQVELEMMDPGSDAVNFEFDFIPLT